jgi:hypothetical protein
MKERQFFFSHKKQKNFVLNFSEKVLKYKNLTFENGVIVIKIFQKVIFVAF